MELWKHKDDVDDESHIKAFLYRAIYTRSLNVIKHRTVVSNHADSVKKVAQLRMEYYNPEANDVMGYIEGVEMRRQINDAISELPAKCREVFILSYQHDRKNKEIAEQLGISIRKSLISKVRMTSVTFCRSDSCGCVEKRCLVVLQSGLSWTSIRP